MTTPRYEHFHGSGIMALTFDSGHVLALRDMPQNDYAPYRAVWHRTPAGAWSMYLDGPLIEEFCPRMYGPILAGTGAARIRTTRPDRFTLVVTMDAPELEWTVRVGPSALTRVANAVLPRLPMEVFRSPPALALIRQLANHALRMGPLDLAGRAPGGQRLLVQPRRMEFVRDSTAVLDGVELGRPVRATENPRTGDFRWPARGVLAEGDIYIEIEDPAAYHDRLARFRRWRREERFLPHGSAGGV